MNTSTRRHRAFQVADDLLNDSDFIALRARMLVAQARRLRALARALRRVK